MGQSMIRFRGIHSEGWSGSRFVIPAMKTLAVSTDLEATQPHPLSTQTPVGQTQNRFRAGAVILCLMVVSLLLGLFQFNNRPVGAYTDDAHYVILAESLVQGSGYRLVNFPDAPVESAFPPGWPLLLTPLVALLPGNFAALHWYTYLFWLAAIPLLYRLLARRLPVPYALSVVAIVALNPLLIQHTTRVLSEAAYIFFAVLSLTLLDHWSFRRPGSSFWLLAAALLLALATVAIRTIGISLVAAMLIYLVITSHWRTTATVMGLLLVGLLPLAWFNLSQGGILVFSQLYRSHVENVGAQLAYFLRFWEHISFFPPEKLASFVVPVSDLRLVATLLTPGLNRALSLIVLALLLGGWLRSLRRMSVIDLYTLCYGAILYFWIVYVEMIQPRLFAPLTPFLVFYLLYGFDWLLARLPNITPRLKQSIFLSAVALLLLANVGRNVVQIIQPTPARWVDLPVAATWVREHTPQDAIVMTTAPGYFYLHTRRLTVSLPEWETGSIAAHIANTGADYVVIRSRVNSQDEDERPEERFAVSNLLPLLQSDPLRFQLVFQDPAGDVVIYRVIHP